MGAYLIDAPLGASAIGKDDLDVHVVVRVVRGLRVALLVLAREEVADEEEEERADEVADADDRPRDVVPAACRQPH